MIPSRLTMHVAGTPAGTGTGDLALHALAIARRLAPKLSGSAAHALVPYAAPGEFGVAWPPGASYLWWQETGIRAFTMRSLAGHTIPMWLLDPTGSLRKDNPKAETRRTADGLVQVLVFRRAAPIGSVKKVVRNGIAMTVPASYPGAPGRIGRRESGSPLTTPGKVAGAIATGNTGVRWRHPGISGRGFLAEALRRTASDHRIAAGRILPGYDPVRPGAVV